MLVIRKTLYLSVLGLVLFFTFTFPPVLVAEVPDLINYQGVLTDDAGIPVPDGNYAMDFTLYTTEVGDTGVWSQTFPAVSIVDGIYNVKLGPFIYPEQIFVGDLYLQVEVNGEVLAPRQQITSVPYALNARVSDTVVNGAITTVMIADGAVNTDKLVDGAVTAAKVTGGFVPNLDADKLDGFDSASFASSTHNHDSRYYSKSEVDALVSGYESRIAALENKLQYLTVVAGTVNGMTGPHVMITGANLHVRSGSGNTDSISGKGNLIVGYNELRGMDDNRSGSHNVIVGKEHNYSSYGGLVVALQNSITSPYASVSGGYQNTASGGYSSVSGGAGNTASNYYSSVSGGERNTASGTRASISGGTYNTASNYWSSVSGGERNTASGYSSSISGGNYNIASGYSSFVGGGGGPNDYEGNLAFADYSAILGGSTNGTGDVTRVYDYPNDIHSLVPGTHHSLGRQSSVSGGFVNIASGLTSVVSGGSLNTADGWSSSISGGYENIASNLASSVSGGYENIAYNVASSVSGGYSNTASGINSSVSGGFSNTARGDESTVSGGTGNLAFANKSAIFGGFHNGTGDVSRSWSGSYWQLSPGIDRLIGKESTVTGGYSNIASGTNSSVSGGTKNTASGNESTVSGGYERSVSEQWNWQGGGYFQDH